MRLFKVTRRRLALGLGSVAVMLVVAALAFSWFYAVQIENGALRVKTDPPEFQVEVMALGAGRITLRSPLTTDPREEPETMGIEGPSGYGRVGEILEIDGVTAVRRYAPLEGSLAVGHMVRYDRAAYPGDPQRAHGIAFDEVMFASPAGELAAWYVDGAEGTWAIFVHGKGAPQGEALRMLPVMVDAGLPSLVITYRNDAGAPEDPSGYYQYGLTEWEDLKAATQYAIACGADDLVLVGYSMGGGIVASFLYSSPKASRVVGVILDSPMLDFEATIDLAAQRRNVPVLLTAAAKRIASLRFDVDWGALNYLDRADELSTPVLLFHGSGDKTVPVGTSETLANSLPDLVTYVSFDAATHVGAWNSDPEKYETAVREFIRRVTR